MIDEIKPTVPVPQEKDVTKTYKYCAHMIAVFQDEDDKYSFISNQFYFSSKKDSIAELVEQYTKNWTAYIIYNSNGAELEVVNNKNWVEEEELESGE